MQPRCAQEVADFLQVLGCFPAEAAARALQLAAPPLAPPNGQGGPAGAPADCAPGGDDLAYALASIIPFRKACRRPRQTWRPGTAASPCLPHLDTCTWMVCSPGRRSVVAAAPARARRCSRRSADAQAAAALRAAPAVAYQGAPGAYSEAAALAAVPGCAPLPCEQFETAFGALNQWLADRAVVPIENSLGGSIHAVYDLLLKRAPGRAPAHARAGALFSSSWSNLGAIQAVQPLLPSAITA